MSEKLPTDDAGQAKLLRLFETDSDRAWDQFLNEFSQVIKKVIWWKLGPKTDEDRAEDIYVKILQKLSEDGCRRIREFKQSCKLSTWLTSIVINQVRDEIKARPRDSLPTVPLPIDADEGQDQQAPAAILPSPLEQIIQKENVEHLRECLKQLPPSETLRLLRRFADQRKLREIAQLETVSEGAIDGRIRKSLKKLRECMEKRRK